MTYGAIAARAAGAEVTNISWSGKGVFTNRGSQTDTVPLPELFNLALPGDPSSKIESEGADLVLINLGTNDFAPEVKDVTPFTKSYKTFVSKVRAMHLNAEILLTVGPLLSDEWPEGKRALSKVRKTLMAEMEVRKASGDEKVHVLEFNLTKVGAATSTPLRKLITAWHESCWVRSKAKSCFLYPNPNKHQLTGNSGPLTQVATP